MDSDIFVVKYLTIYGLDNIEEALYLYKNKDDAEKKFEELIVELTKLHNINNSTYSIFKYENFYKAVSKDGNISHFINSDPYYIC